MVNFTERIVDFKGLRFNPVVSFVAFFALWGLTIWCIMESDDAEQRLKLLRDEVAYWFTWLYIGSQDVWIAFAAYIYIYYGSKKMCKPGNEAEKPEFSDSTYFMMLFTCGVAVGMFYYGTTEPTSYYTGYSGNRYHQDPGISGSEKAQWAITLSVFHWGLHGWIPYCLVALTLGFASYRQDKPLTMRSTLYPLLGDRVNSWVGDVIDILSILVVIAGVCTSLGLGTDQISQGIYRLNQNNFDYDVEEEKKTAWTVIIVLITLVACVSVVSGIHYGIKYIAITAFMLANFLWLMVFCLDDPVYSLDIMVQTVGHYLQHFLELGFATDAFQRQINHGNDGVPNTDAADGFVYGADNETWTAGDAMDAANKPGYMFPGAPSDAYDGVGGNPKFMQWWTIFYWGWWIAWSPFVGMFIARISKGRTIREVFNYSMTAPLFYVIMWFAVFGGAGIKMHNSALECAAQAKHDFDGTPLTQVLYNPYNGTSMTIDTKGAGHISERYQQSVCCEVETVLRKTGGWQVLTVEGTFDKTAYPTGIVSHNMCQYLRPAAGMDVVLGVNGTLTADEVAFLTDASVTKDESRQVIYEFSYATANFFEILEQYYGWGQFLSGVTILTIILYFVTSSDSGSFVVDLISAGGNKDKDGNEKDPHPIQRVVWSITEGAVAIGLMYAGGTSGTGALQALSVAVGLPFTVVICYMMPSLLRMLEIEDGGAKPTDWDWKMPIFGGFFDIFDVIFSVGGMFGGCPSASDLIESFKQMIIGAAPFIHARQTLDKLDVDGKNKTKNMVRVFFLFGLWVTWIVSLIMQDHGNALGGWWAFAIVMYTGMVAILTSIRADVRESQNIKGNFIEDFISCFLLYFQVGPQCWIQVNETKAEEAELKEINDEKSAVIEAPSVVMTNV